MSNILKARERSLFFDKALKLFEIYGWKAEKVSRQPTDYLGLYSEATLTKRGCKAKMTEYNLRFYIYARSVKWHSFYSRIAEIGKVKPYIWFEHYPNMAFFANEDIATVILALCPYVRFVTEDKIRLDEGWMYEQALLAVKYVQSVVPNVRFSENRFMGEILVRRGRVISVEISTGSLLLLASSHYRGDNVCFQTPIYDSVGLIIDKVSGKKVVVACPLVSYLLSIFADIRHAAKIGREQVLEEL